jgi:hypothetical protein
MVTLLRQLTDTDTNALREIVDQIVEKPADLRIDELKRLGWVAVPVEAATHIDEPTLHRILGVCASANVNRLLAAETEVLVTERRFFSMPATLDALREFNWELGPFYCTLCPDDYTWMILCTKDDYYAVAGPELVVETILGQPLNAALETFRAFASAVEWPANDRRFLEGVAQKYAAVSH